MRDRLREAAGRDLEPNRGRHRRAVGEESRLRARRNAGLRRREEGERRKRHVIVDCLGLLLMVLVTPADVTDRQAAWSMLPRLRTRFRRVRLPWADGGYSGRLVDWAREHLRLRVEIVKRTDDTTGFTVLPRRWCVEGTLAWLMRSRRLARDYETRPASREAVVQWSMAMLRGRRLARRAVSRTA